MKKVIKISAIVAVLFIVSGVFLSTTGVLLGANKSISFDEDGIQVGDSEPYSYVSEELKNIDNVKIDVVNAKVEILPSAGDYYKVEVNISNDEEAPEVIISDSTIDIKQEDINYIFNWDLDFFENSDIITVYVPVDSKLNVLNIETSNGSVDIKSIINVDKLDVDTSNGRIIIEEMICNGDADVKSSNGSIECNGTFKKSTQIKTSNGRIEINGKFYGNTYCKTSNGSMTINLEETVKQYDIKADTNNGSIYVNDEKVSDDYSLKNNAENDIELKTSNGSIRVNFLK